MNPNPEVAVLGAGIIGSAIARELARRGAKVRLFEARAVASGATHASAGVLAPHIEASTGVLLDMATRSLDLYDRFIESVRLESGIDVEYRRCGTLEVAESEDDEQRFRERLASRPSPSDRGKWLSSDAVRALEPSLAETVRGGLLELTHGYVQVSRLTEALVWAAMHHGVELETHRRINRVEASSDRVVLTAEDSQQWTVDKVVMATGSWTSRSGLDEPAARAVHPVRGQLLQLRSTGRPLTHVLWGGSCYVVPWTDGTLLVGATAEDVGFDERTTAAGVRDLLDAVCELVPEAWNASFVEARAGLRPATSDGLPIIGLSKTPGVIYATGHYRNGVLLAPLTASLIADLVISNQLDPLLQFLQPSRFDERGQTP